MMSTKCDGLLGQAPRDWVGHLQPAHLAMQNHLPSKLSSYGYVDETEQNHYNMRRVKIGNAILAGIEDVVGRDSVLN